MSYAKGKNFNVVFLPLRYSAGDTYRGSGLVWVCFGYLKVNARLNFMTKIGLRLGMLVNTTPDSYCFSED